MIQILAARNDLEEVVLVHDVGKNLERVQRFLIIALPRHLADQSSHDHLTLLLHLLLHVFLKVGVIDVKQFEEHLGDRLLVAVIQQALENVIFSPKHVWNQLLIFSSAQKAHKFGEVAGEDGVQRSFFGANQAHETIQKSVLVLYKFVV